MNAFLMSPFTPPFRGLGGRGPVHRIDELKLEELTGVSDQI